MAEKPIEASKMDFSQLAGQHAKKQAVSLDLATITKVSQALIYVSQERAMAYLQQVRENHYPWVNAKNLLEELVAGLSAESPRISSALFKANLDYWWKLPHAIERRVTKLGEIASAVYNQLDLPFAQREEFRQLRDGAQALLQQHGPELKARHEAYNAVKGLKPEANIESAVEVITSEGQDILKEAASKSRFTFIAAMPVTAMLYLLQVAKTSEEKAVVRSALDMYQQRLGDATVQGFKPPKRGYQGVLLQRVTAAVGAVQA